MSEVRELVIDRLGAQGDGVAESEGVAVYVPFALPGERVMTEISGDRVRLVEVIEPSKARVAPVCQHFGICGGCVAQHMAPEFYRAWKRDLVMAAFRSRGLSVDVQPLFVPGGKRRRAVLTARRRGAIAEIGFHQAHSHALVDIEECPVLEPKIVAVRPALRNLAEPHLAARDEARLTVTSTGSGIDVQIEGLERRLTPDVSARLAAGASRLGLARLAVGKDVVCETAAPALSFGPADVVLPPGAFVQAVAEAEQAIARLIIKAVGRAKTVADLFCGLGAFTFPLAMGARVSAFDGDRSAVAALGEAAKKAKGIKPIDARVRDLFREPLSTTEINEHEAMVFDPPRAGAEAQARRLAQSKVRTIVAVSCNAATLARDARHLIDGGYSLDVVTPIDQFVFSSHVEVVAVFRR